MLRSPVVAVVGDASLLLLFRNNIHIRRIPTCVTAVGTCRRLLWLWHESVYRRSQMMNVIYGAVICRDDDGEAIQEARKYEACYCSRGERVFTITAERAPARIIDIAHAQGAVVQGHNGRCMPGRQQSAGCLCLVALPLWRGEP